MLLALLWWVLAIGAAVQVGRAWGVLAGLGAALALLVVSWVPLLGGLASVVGAVALGARAEQVIDSRRIPARP